MANLNDGKVQLAVRVAPEVREEIKILSIRRKRHVQEEVEEALRKHLAEAQQQKTARP
jgi:hypothetical protein